MVYTCFLCKWRGDRYPRRSYHKFPLNAELKQKWLDILGKSGVSIGARTTLCSIHFEEDCFRYGLVNGRRILQDGSLPTLHLKNINRKQTFDSIDQMNHPEPLVEGTLHVGLAAEFVQTEPQIYRKDTDSHDEMPDNISMYGEEELSPPPDTTHKDDVKTNDALKCSVCDHSITEFRYTCVQCSDLDLCGACEAARAHHHHYVLRVPADRHATEVQFVLATIRRYLKTVDPKTVPEPDWDGPLSVKSEIKSECKDDDELIPTAGQVSYRTVSWAACEQKEHTNCFTNIRIKLGPVDENDTVHFSCADEGDSCDGRTDANGMVNKENDAGTECGTSTSNAGATSSRNDMQDEATSTKKICIRSGSSMQVDLKNMEHGALRDEKSEESDVADNGTPSKKLKSIKLPPNFTNMNDSKFMQTYRMSKRTVLEISSQIDKELDYSTNIHKAVAPIDQILMTLRYYATGTNLLNIGLAHGVSAFIASKLIRKVSSTIVTLRDKYIHMPTAEEVERCQKEFYSIAHFPFAIGRVDCTHVKIQPPGGDNCNVFKNKHGYFSVNVQTVADSKLRIRDVVAHSPGSTTDAGVFEDSMLSHRFETGEYSDAYLLGDSAYPLKKYLLTPYLQPTTEAQKRYNKSHSETRNAVENLHSLLKRRFPALAIGLQINLQTAVDMVTACCILHNICVENAEDIPPPGIDNEGLEAYIEQGRIDEVYDKPGHEDRRRAITCNFFSGYDAAPE